MARPQPSPSRPRRDSAARRITACALYCRLTLAFVLGLYLPSAAQAPDLARHVAEALHSWVIVFFAPVAAWRFSRGLLSTPRRPTPPAPVRAQAASTAALPEPPAEPPADPKLLLAQRSRAVLCSTSARIPCRRPHHALHEKALSRSFYATQPAPCPYLPGRIEQRIVTPFFTGDEPAFFDSLNQAGFRRSHGFLYRPACPGCQACIPVRVPVARFVWSRRFRKVAKRNADLVAQRRPAIATDEQYALFKRYLQARHDDGGMARMSREDYRELVENAPADTFVVEFRRGGELIATALSDQLVSGLSGVYKFFAPDLEKRSLGTFVILWHIDEAARLGLPFVYLGYWIERSRKMRYKAQFQPMEQLSAAGWCALPPIEDQADGVRAAARPPAAATGSAG